jgi:hypothetical protein
MGYVGVRYYVKQFSILGFLSPCVFALHQYI